MTGAIPLSTASLQMVNLYIPCYFTDIQNLSDCSSLHSAHAALTFIFHWWSGSVSVPTGILVPMVMIRPQI